MYKLVILISIAFIGAGLVKKEKKSTTPLVSDISEDQPKELGKVKWLRDLKKATTQSSNEDKPIFLLFQEVPGCATCRNYGHNVLSHPLIVEAIETYFVPLAIFNSERPPSKKVASVNPKGV